MWHAWTDSALSVCIEVLRFSSPASHVCIEQLWSQMYHGTQFLGPCFTWSMQSNGRYHFYWLHITLPRPLLRVFCNIAAFTDSYPHHCNAKGYECPHRPAPRAVAHIWLWNVCISRLVSSYNLQSQPLTQINLQDNRLLRCNPTELWLLIRTLRNRIFGTFNNCS